jgi:hypothetical protein
MRCVYGDWINSAQDKEECQVLVKMVMDPSYSMDLALKDTFLLPAI